MSFFLTTRAINWVLCDFTSDPQCSKVSGTRIGSDHEDNEMSAVWVGMSPSVQLGEWYMSLYLILRAIGWMVYEFISDPQCKWVNDIWVYIWPSVQLGWMVYKSIPDPQCNGVNGTYESISDPQCNGVNCIIYELISDSQCNRVNGVWVYIWPSVQ